LTGVVTGEAPADESAAKLRPFVEALDPEPVCPPELLELARRTAARFFASTGEVLRSILPARLPAAGAVRYRITERGAFGRARGLASGAEADVLASLAGGGSVAARDLPGGADRGAALRSLEDRGEIRAVSDFRDRRRRMETAYEPARLDAASRERLLARRRRGAEILAWLEALERPATAAEIRLATGAGPAAIRSLARLGLLRSFEQSVSVAGPGDVRAEAREVRAAFTLTAAQDAAVSAIVSAVSARRYFPALLQGVTGSGKTEVYLRAIGAALDAGRGAIWLVPEIALTPVFAR